MGLAKRIERRSSWTAVEMKTCNICPMYLAADSRLRACFILDGRLQVRSCYADLPEALACDPSGHGSPGQLAFGSYRGRKSRRDTLAPGHRIRITKADFRLARSEGLHLPVSCQVLARQLYSSLECSGHAAYALICHCHGATQNGRRFRCLRWQSWSANACLQAFTSS